MKTIAIFKAHPTIGPVESATIIMDEEVPTFAPPATLETVRDLYIDQGKKLADVLCSTLPGGTLDQLICELLTRKASLFRVPLFNKKEE
ncbi:MAG: hypothetical protein ABFD62_12930 [Syntrophaceae bacterium]